VVVAALIVGVLIVAALLLGSGHHGKGSGGLLAPIPIATVTVWIQPPFQTVPDDPGEAGYTHDGNVRTAWQSTTYPSSNFGKYVGEGLAIHVSPSTTLHQLKVTSYNQGWAATTYVADSSAPRLAEWGTPTDQKSNNPTVTTFDLGGRQGSWILLWMTNTGTGSALANQISIAELDVS
jgi:hypothetical protein